MAEVSLSITIHKTLKRVLWTETDKDFVDFLYCLYSIPMGQVLKFLNDNESLGCLRNPYQSVHLLENDFLMCDKDDILKPKFILSSVPSLLNVESNSIVDPFSLHDSCTTLDLYTCKCSPTKYSTFKDYCLICRADIDIPVKLRVPNPTSVAVDGERDGFVKGGGAKYVVTDDLSVSPKSTFSFLAYFNAMHITIVALNELIGGEGCNREC